MKTLVRRGSVAVVCALAGLLLACPRATPPPPADSGNPGTDAATGPCGNGALDPGEQCDGANLNGADCLTLMQGFVGGTLACAGNCTLNTSGCMAPAGCGDGMIGGTEQCDGANLNGATCTSQGFMGGTLACTGGCMFDTGGCTACGNGTCDGGETCTTCPGDCGICPPVCGNGVREGTEECDGADFGGLGCADFGLTGSPLTCDAGCTISRTTCTGPDLIVYEGGLLIDSYVQTAYNPSTCEEAFGCVGGTMGRTVLHFTLVSENVGNQVLHFGSPSSILAPYSGLWTYDSCWGWYQFDDYAAYWLCPSTVADCENAPATDHVAEGHKASFCFIENFGVGPDYTGTPPGNCGSVYSCSDMGQRPGCADDYYVGLDCQFIDITGVASGTYTLCAQIDPANMIYELRDDNNTSCTPVSF